MKDLRPIRGHTFLSRAVVQGEHLTQDFKFAITDAHKIAHSISAFANNAGGRLLVGVKDNGAIAGIRTDEDIYLLEQAAQMYCIPAQELHFTAYKTEGGRAIVVSAEVAPSPEKGVMCIEADGSRQAYFRIHNENIAVTPLMLDCWRARYHSASIPTGATDAEREVLARLDAHGPMLPERLAASIRRSAETLRGALLRLYAMELIEFTFVDRKFHITAI